MQVLIVEQNRDLRRAITETLAALVETQAVGKCKEALGHARSGRFPLVVLGGVGTSDWESIDLLQQLKQLPSCPDVLFVATASSEGLAIAALRSGAKDYVRSVADPKELSGAVGSWMQVHNRAPQPGSTPLHRMVGKSLGMTDLRDYIAKIAPSMCNVLVTGETGTGKELVAELIHLQSPRCVKSFVCINCAAVPDPLFESELFGYERGAFTGAVSGKDGQLSRANGGTVFLDEIGDMSLAAQAKILRAIESREVYRLGGRHGIALDVRIIAATNQELEVLTRSNLFRKDLYYRLNVARISLAPLRDRREDIPELLEHFLEMFSRKCSFAIKGFSKDAVDCLTEYSWPGNARELRNVVESVFATRPASLVRPKDLPSAVTYRGSRETRPASGDRDQLMDALRTSSWNKSQAAKKLRWSRMTVYRKIVEYGIQIPTTLPIAAQKDNSTVADVL
jgi:DNA-binding NtrC family response regulator